MNKQLLELPGRKNLRAALIFAHLNAAKPKSRSHKPVICFSCGNAARALRNTGLEVLHIGPHGDLTPNYWFTPEAIGFMFPNHFDATSGHLPAHLMVEYGKRLRQQIGALDPTIEYDVPTGSGETIVSLRWVYPGIKFAPVFNTGPHTEFHAEAPLMTAVLGE